MASKIYPESVERASKANQEQVIDMTELGERLARRKAELGLPDMPRNPGQNRTPSKRALLKAIAEAGGKW